MPRCLGAGVTYELLAKLFSTSNMGLHGCPSMQPHRLRLDSLDDVPHWTAQLCKCVSVSIWMSTVYDEQSHRRGMSMTATALPQARQTVIYRFSCAGQGAVHSPGAVLSRSLEGTG